MIRWNIYGNMIEPNLRDHEDHEEWLRLQREKAASRPVALGRSGTFDDWGVVYYEETVRDAIPFEDKVTIHTESDHEAEGEDNERREEEDEHSASW